jgi:hypothetical protein
MKSDFYDYDHDACREDNKCGHCWDCVWETPCDEHGTTYCPACIEEDERITAQVKARIAERPAFIGVLS